MMLMSLLHVKYQKAIYCLDALPFAAAQEFRKAGNFH